MGRLMQERSTTCISTPMPPFYQFVDDEGNVVNPSIIDAQLRDLYNEHDDDKYRFCCSYYELIRVAMYAHETPSGEFDKYRFFDAFTEKNVDIKKMRDFFFILRKQFTFELKR
jgi:hypothetical protein